MNSLTAPALAFAGAALALPAVALGAAEHPPSPEQTVLSAPNVGHESVRAQMHAARRLQRARQLTVRAVHLQERIARVRGVHVAVKRERHRLRGATPEQLRRVVRRREHQLAHARRTFVRTAAAPAAPAAAAGATSPNLQAIAACESGGNPSTNTGNGFYGKYQFTQQTWASVGGTGNPAAASEAEQDARAAQLYAQSGSSPWPVCGR